MDRIDIAAACCWAICARIQNEKWRQKHRWHYLAVGEDKNVKIISMKIPLL